mgnify:FL=1
MSIERKVLGTSPSGGGGDVPEAVSFDGTSDYLSRSTDMTGNADGKTFTFSCWVYWDGASDITLFSLSNGKFFTSSVGVGRLYFSGANAAGTNIFEMFMAAAEPFVADTWSHVLISVDMANTANRSVYVNDVLLASNTWNTYTNDTLDFTGAAHLIAQRSSNIKGHYRN